jgi:hypothetical protein
MAWNSRGQQCMQPPPNTSSHASANDGAAPSPGSPAATHTGSSLLRYACENSNTDALRYRLQGSNPALPRRALNPKGKA